MWGTAPDIMHWLEQRTKLDLQKQAETAKVNSSEADLDVAAPIADTYARGTSTNAQGEAAVRKPIAL